MGVADLSLNFCGGAQVVTLAMIDALRSRGHEVTLITADKVDWEKVKIYLNVEKLPDHEKSATTYDIIQSLGENPVQGFFLVISFVRKLLSSIKEQDVVINAYGDLDLAIGVANICFFNSFPFSLSNLFPKTAPSVMRGSYTAGLYKALKAISPMKRKCLVLTNSNYMKEILSRYLKLSALVVHPPVKLDDFRVDLEREDIVITVSRYVPGKELDKLLIIAKLVDNAKFLIIGRAYDRSYLSLLFKLKDSLGLDNVEILSNIPRKRLIDLIGRARLYLHANPKEPFGISIVEAMASGCVPIVPREGGPWIDILSGSDGIFGYSYTNPDEAAFHIRKLIKNEDLWQEISSRCVKRSKHFDKKFFNKKFVKIVEEYANRIQGKTLSKF